MPCRRPASATRRGDDRRRADHQQYAEEIGADGYSDKRQYAVTMARKLVKPRARKADKTRDCSHRLRNLSPDARQRRFYYGAESVVTRGMVRPCAANLPSWPHPAGRSAHRLISVTDNPGGSPMLPPDWLAGQLSG